MNATVPDVVAELQVLIGQNDQVMPMKNLLIGLSKRAGSSIEHDKIIKRLTNAKILPMKGNSTKLQSFKDDTWFVSDNKVLENCFKGFVALLDFDKDDLETLSPLLKLFNVQRRTLSASVFEETKIGGVSIEQPAFTKLLRSKASAIAW